MHNEIMMDYIQRLFERHGLNTCVSTCFCFSKLPIEKLLFQARWNLRPWSDLELLLENLPPRMAKNALMRGEDRYMRTPLHDVAWKAPRSIIKLILALAPDATRIKDKDGELPLHSATYNNNIDAIKLLVDEYPDAVLEKNNKGETPLHCAAESAKNNDHSKRLRADIVKLLVRIYPKAILTTVQDGILNMDDIKFLVVEWSNQALQF